MGAACESTHPEIGGRSSLLVLRYRYAWNKAYDVQGCDKYSVCDIFISEYGSRCSLKVFADRLPSDHHIVEFYKLFFCYLLSCFRFISNRKGRSSYD